MCKKCSFHFPFLLVVLLFLCLVSCSGDANSGATSQPAVPVNPLAPASELSEEIRTSPANVQEAYRFALANPDILKQAPCYCGCGSMGHQSNYECYVSGSGGDGKLHFDSHALG
jgi:hypothetical protein